MAVLNNLIVGLVLHLGWTNLPEARRYYDAHPAEARRIVMRQAGLTLEKPCEGNQGFSKVDWAMLQPPSPAATSPVEPPRGRGYEQV